MSLCLPDVFRSYRPNITFSIDSNNFIVKIAETKEELLGAFRLRNSVFYEEWTGQPSESGLDIDEYDPLADHLIVIQKNTNEVMGTYRLINTKFSRRFYTETFFNINPFLNKKQGNKIEMGRACTHKSLRGSQAIHHIWLGLAKYFRRTLSRYMFGCVSIIDTSPEYMGCVYKTFLEEKIIDKDVIVPVIEKYKVADFKNILLRSKADKSSLLKLPRLFLWYLSLGIKIHSLPVYDPNFGSYDFFITLDFKSIQNPKLVNRYEDAVYLKNKLL